jgi:TatD DNase family protein
MPLFDAHLHFLDARLTPYRAQAEEVALRAHVTHGITCAAFPEEWETHPDTTLNLTYAYGLHPWCAATATPDTLAALRECLLRHPAALIGETGRDALRPVLDGGLAQQRLFAFHLELAATLQRPLILHGARAWQALFTQLAPWITRLPAVMIHGAGFAPEMLKSPLFAQHHNLWFSFGGAILNPRARTVRALAAQVPLNRLLIETDAPDGLPATCAPLDARSLNHPGTLPHILETLAQLRSLPTAELAAETFQNALRFIRAEV